MTAENSQERQDSIRVGDIVLWKVGDGVFLKVTDVRQPHPLARFATLDGEDANGTLHTVPLVEVHPACALEEPCEMCR